MRAVIQRVSHAGVVVAGESRGAIERGLLVLLGVGADDDASDVCYLAEKTAGLRIFEDAEGKMNLSPLGLSRFLASLLYQTSQYDLMTFLIVPAVLSAAALIACAVPARRAARVDPLIALRAE